MSKGKSVFRCTECGADQPKWGGKCDACGAWNSLIEEAVGRMGRRADGPSRAGSGAAPVRLSEMQTATVARWKTGLAEFDFVLGGGIVPGSLVLIGGSPGIGKSTLTLAAVANVGGPVLYVTGEESPCRLGERAERPWLVQLTECRFELTAAG